MKFIISSHSNNVDFELYKSLMVNASRTKLSFICFCKLNTNIVLFKVDKNQGCS